MSATQIALLVSFVALGILTQHHCLSIKLSTNATEAHDEEGGDEEDAAAIRERYRRLIPYMTYYLVNNYVGAQQQPAQGYAKPHPVQPVQQQYSTVRPVNKQRYQTPAKDDRFVPSVQYDPKDINENGDYFVPVRYALKETYDDYASVTPAIRTTRPMPVTETQYHTTVRPTSFLPAKLKPQVTKLQQDYMYGRLAPEEFESVRYSKAPRVQGGPRYVQQQPRPTVLEPVPPRVSLSHVIKSLQLTNRLPEVLNKDNIDSSIKTLEEILDILDAGKKDNDAPVHEQFNAAYMKPKVITESNYEASQISVTPHKELVLSRPVRPYVAPLKSHVPANLADLVQIKTPSHYITQIKTQLPNLEEELIELKYVPQIKTQIPVPHKEIVELNPYINQIKVPIQSPHQQVVEIKPDSHYDKPTPPQVPDNQGIIQIKPIDHYVKPIQTQVPVNQEEVVEIKPQNPYINVIKTQTLTTPIEAYSKPPSEVKKIIEYYIPIIQDIDEVKKPQTTSAEKEPARFQSTDHSTESNYNATNNNHEILDDERYSLPVTTEKPQHKITMNVPSIPPLLKYGATRGKPHIDYPAYTEIPETDFSCKLQRYKGFFGDPQTGCQVWHYCDLNGGKSSFLCPNGTIFSQVALTCDWWFNVKCETTTQLYVLNERLYKYILPIMPKFPEDFSGPEVDKYLELKFKEMEVKMKQKKMKKEQEEKDKNTINTLQSIEDSRK